MAAFALKESKTSPLLPNTCQPGRGVGGCSRWDRRFPFELIHRSPQSPHGTAEGPAAGLLCRGWLSGSKPSRGCFAPRVFGGTPTPWTSLLVPLASQPLPFAFGCAAPPAVLPNPLFSLHSCLFLAFPPSSSPRLPPPSSPLTLESLFLLLCSSKTISIKVIDDEEYEKNKTFYLEIGEPRLVEMSEKKGGGRAPGLSPACVSLSGSLMPSTCNTELTSAAPAEKGRSGAPRKPRGCFCPSPPAPSGCAAASLPPQPSRHHGGRELHARATPIMCLPLSCVPTGNSLPLEYLTVRSMRKSAVSSLCLGTRCGYDEE